MICPVCDNELFIVKRYNFLCFSCEKHKIHYARFIFDDPYQIIEEFKYNHYIVYTNITSDNIFTDLYAHNTKIDIDMENIIKLFDPKCPDIFFNKISKLKTFI